jgi:putative tryptophan/tyrosine transport system substrate-binding protein
MRRRVALSLLAGALAAPASARLALAQTGPRIVILHSGWPDRSPTHILIQYLRELRYEDGRTAKIEIYGAEGDPARLATLVGRIAAQPADLIFALTEPAAMALKKAGVAAPVVFLFVSDPVAHGLVASLSRPGANITGISMSDGMLGSKRVELLADALPGLHHLAILWSAKIFPNAEVAAAAGRAASALGMRVSPHEFDGWDGLEQAFRDAESGGAQAALFLTDNFLFGDRKRVAALALAHRLPMMHFFPPEVEDGGLMAFGMELRESYRRAADMAHRILRGARPADLPVEEPTKFTLTVNLRTARALGIELPAAFVARADEVIE